MLCCDLVIPGKLVKQDKEVKKPEIDGHNILFQRILSNKYRTRTGKKNSN